MNPSPVNQTEAQFTEETVAHVAAPRACLGSPQQNLEHIIANRNDDWQFLWDRLRLRGNRLIVPHLSTRVNRNQDKRALRWNTQFWIIEQTNTRLHNFRHLGTRYDNEIEPYRTSLHATYMLITLRQS